MIRVQGVGFLLEVLGFYPPVAAPGSRYSSQSSPGAPVTCLTGSRRLSTKVCSQLGRLTELAMRLTVTVTVGGRTCEKVKQKVFFSQHVEGGARNLLLEMSNLARTFMPGPKLSESFLMRFRAITNLFSLLFTQRQSPTSSICG